MNKRVNPVFIQQGVGGKVKHMCSICKVYHVKIGEVMRCPKCGEKTPMQGMVTVDNFDIVADISEPAIINKKEPDEQDDYPLPDGGQWVEQKEDGGS